MSDHWIEEVCCPRCRRTGKVSLSQATAFAIPTVDQVADGFETVQTKYGPHFHCGLSGIPVIP